MRDEHVVNPQDVHRLSFSAIGTPASGPARWPASTAAACLFARSAATELYARIFGSIFSIRASSALVSSSDETAASARKSQSLGESSRYFTNSVAVPGGRFP